MALLGHNTEFGWSLTMFENNDVDLTAEKANPSNANQVWVRGQWVDMETDAFKDNYGKTAVVMWWAFLENENPVLQAFYELNRANTPSKARAAIARRAAAKLPIHPAGVNPTFILGGSTEEAEKTGFYNFSFNSHEDPQYLSAADVKANTKSVLPLRPCHLLSTKVTHAVSS